MIRLSVVRKLGLVAVVALVLVGGTLFAQLSDLSGENSLLGDEVVIGLPGAEVHEDAKLTASDAASFDFFGRNVAVFGDTALAGAFFDDHAGGADAGSAYVFVRSGTTWTEQAKLTASDAAPDDEFGGRVALSGNTAVVAAFRDDHAGGTDAGSVYVFVRSGTTWTEQAKLTASDAAASDLFGNTLALSGDTAAVGAGFDDHAGALSGSAYVFVRNGTTWTEQAKLTASDAAAGDLFSFPAVSGDTAVVGAPLDDHAGGADAGSAYVFVRSGTTWTEQAKLTASDAASGEQFGGSVALSGDTVVLGAKLDDHAGALSGSAYVFVRNGTTWTEQAKLTASDAAAGDLFGSVALSGDTAVVAASRDDPGGSAYVFVRSGTTWTEQAKLTASDAAAGDRFGSPAVSGDTAVVGADADDHAGGTDAGSVYVFRLLCGDGILDPAEECDDGNNNSCDGCSAICEHEMGFVCGDGGLNTECGEECDDGNNEDGDGCASDCTLEEPVPAVSYQGAIVLVLLLLTITAVMLWRRRSAA